MFLAVSFHCRSPIGSVSILFNLATRGIVVESANQRSDGCLGSVEPGLAPAWAGQIY